MKCGQKESESIHWHGHCAGHTLLNDGLEAEVIGGFAGGTGKGIEFVVSKIGGNNRAGLNQKVKWGEVEGEVTKGGPPGFPRGHGAPVGYSNINNPRGRVLTMGQKVTIVVRIDSK